MKNFFILLLIGFLILVSLGEGAAQEETPLGMAVEFMDHAACAYISQDKGWFKEEGLNLTTYESYVTGMALAAALARGDIQVAYICLIPAINVYANAKVPIKIVAGTHKYGYGLVVNPDKVKIIQDLEKPDIRLGCVREGGAVDVLLHRTMDNYNLNKEKILNRIQRMDPVKQVLAIKMGQLDAAFLPEQWATMAEESGFKMLLMSQEVWPEMQGSVLVVKEELIKNHPDLVKKLVKVTKRATNWANQYREEAAEIMARQLQIAKGSLFPINTAEEAGRLDITPEVLFRSMERLKYTTDINPEMVQETIDYLAKLGYIKSSFPAEDILDLSFIEE
ncbi:MAG: nitrate ABC transporter substrate-binding protein [Candidatus Infernicultor aquiphilus]|uniref:Nitrate ABC transporter substrate-binding protein n=1 Tax=Candidatus Infernicultor aquiphilus TaxID=1805029 RepID=A0A1J5GYF5_9BACT|nr:ABC transporter substrate-binding protein [bacterium]OIP72838.1 MAG: nitrate ABC transporter substrate-binding protein [Candidatus Atribacteria bacterium CG2_30_33_13]PIU24654.1 MAG: nitrate ABC transporter substrate-binding protein [Candidatus Atribacteria bacterium CG08_land_8_20_14_0_20_33_29]PIW11254.1 MAG: nitrate ABC transporter substrate-binding protein [Candidatus Atribacteria bacterium CG17_big_fil_post_rev_8_21_14_2_50_34_11]PIX34084.1 MAG: nitrate ABC transporter substrate-binding